MTRRAEFSATTKRAAWERSGGICECGCGVEIKPGDGPEYHHSIEAALRDDASLDNCVVLRKRCHRAITGSRVAELAKVNRIAAKQANIRPKSKRPMPGSRASGWKQKIGGGWERRS